MRDLHAIKVVIDRAGRKQLLIDGEEVRGVQDVTLRFSRDVLTEVSIDLVSDDVTVSELELREDPHVSA